MKKLKRNLRDGGVVAAITVAVVWVLAWRSSVEDERFRFEPPEPQKRGVADSTAKMLEALAPEEVSEIFRPVFIFQGESRIGCGTLFEDIDGSAAIITARHLFESEGSFYEYQLMRDGSDGRHPIGSVELLEDPRIDVAICRPGEAAPIPNLSEAYERPRVALTLPFSGLSLTNLASGRIVYSLAFCKLEGSTPIPRVEAISEMITGPGESGSGLIDEGGELMVLCGTVLEDERAIKRTKSGERWVPSFFVYPSRQETGSEAYKQSIGGYLIPNPRAFVVDQASARAEGNVTKRLLQASAANGDPYALHSLGLLALKGEQPDEEKACELLSRARAGLELAAESNDRGAMCLLALIHSQGIGVAVSAENAAYWHQRAAELGVPEAARETGLAYWRGSGLPGNAKEAEAWIRRAADLGDGYAACLLGFMHERWTDLRDTDEALRWYLESARREDPYGIVELENFLLKRRASWAQAREAGVELVKMAEDGNELIMATVGKLYAKGVGFPRDRKLAQDWFWRWTGGEGSQAYLWMDGFIRDCEKTKYGREWAANWIEFGLKNESSPSNALLRRGGEIYEKGEGREKDLAKAREHYERAANGGDVAAMRALAKLLLGMAGEHPTNEEYPKLEAGRAWLRKGAELGDGSSALMEAVQCLTFDRDFEKSLVWARKGAASDDEEAGKLLDEYIAKAIALGFEPPAFEKRVKKKGGSEYPSCEGETGEEAGEQAAGEGKGTEGTQGTKVTKVAR